jgi:phycocyanobilin:ferredoxin oxidoreductase
LIWDQLIDFKNEIVKHFDSKFERYSEKGLEKFNYAGWANLTWRSDKFRRIHLDVVDAREERKLWMMHVCAFPVLNSGAPIYGFDVISGKSKVTGAFHDFSVVDENHDALKVFEDKVSGLEWSKERQLPDWAKAIFSKNMIAAGNIQTPEELTTLLDITRETTRWYFEDMDLGPEFQAKERHNRYAFYQKQNPHTPRTMKSLGLNEDDVEQFVSKCLFPEV